MHLVFSPVELDLMAAVKAVFDPLDLCNPGKVLPLARGAAAEGDGVRT